MREGAPWCDAAPGVHLTGGSFAVVTAGSTQVCGLRTDGGISCVEIPSNEL